MKKRKLSKQQRREAWALEQEAMLFDVGFTAIVSRHPFMAASIELLRRPEAEPADLERASSMLAYCWYGLGPAFLMYATAKLLGQGCREDYVRKIMAVAAGDTPPMNPATGGMQQH